MLTLHAIPAFEDNYLWAMVAADGRTVVVDPGSDSAVCDFLAAEGRTLAAILITHHHPDHIGGLAALRARFAVPCYGPDEARIAPIDVRVGDGDRIELPALGLSLQVLSVPGHTHSHIAYSGHGWLFCGDTLFSLGCGRLFEGTPAQMLASLDRLAALPDETLVCCAHEYTLANARFALAVDPDNAALQARVAAAQAQRAAQQPTVPVPLRAERDANPFLRVDTPAVMAALTRHDGSTPADRVDAFARLRRWKDGFCG